MRAKWSVGRIEGFARRPIRAELRESDSKVRVLLRQNLLEEGSANPRPFLSRRRWLCLPLLWPRSTSRRWLCLPLLAVAEEGQAEERQRGSAMAVPAFAVAEERQAEKDWRWSAVVVPAAAVAQSALVVPALAVAEEGQAEERWRGAAMVVPAFAVAEERQAEEDRQGVDDGCACPCCGRGGPG